MKAKIDDRVMAMDGSLDGHTGIVTQIKSSTCIRIKLEATGVEVDVSNYLDLPRKLFTAQELQNTASSAS